MASVVRRIRRECWRNGHAPPPRRWWHEPAVYRQTATGRSTKEEVPGDWERYTVGRGVL